MGSRLPWENKWVPGIINKTCGPLTYQVAVSKGLWKRHIDQLVQG